MQVALTVLKKKWWCHPSIKIIKLCFPIHRHLQAILNPQVIRGFLHGPSLDTPVAQSRSEDSGFGPWHLHSATPSETPQCGDSNSGGERMERMEGGWSMKRLEKDVMRQLVRHKKYQKHSNYICAYTRICLLHLCFESSTLKVCGRRHPSCFSTCYPSIRLVSRACGAERKCSRFSLQYWSCRGTGVVSRQWVTTWHSTFSMTWGSLEERGSFLFAYRWCMGNEYFLYVKRIDRCGSSSYASLTQKLSFRWMHASPSTIVWLDILYDCMTVGFLDSRF